MASIYYNSEGKEVQDGDVVYAADLNTINDAVNTAFEQAESDIVAATGNSGVLLEKAEAWAENPVDTPVEAGKYSAYHWAMKGSGFATQSSSDRTQTTADRAQTSADRIQTSADRVQTGLDRVQTTSDRIQTVSDRASVSADTAYVAGVADNLANILDSPALTGVPTAPTASSDTNTTQISTCEFVYTATRHDKLHSIGNAGTSLSLAPLTYDTFVFTCDQATLTLTVTSLAIGRTINLVITGADNCTITWPSGTKWPNGIAPTFSSGTDRVVMQRVDGSTIHASSAGSAYA
jgi:hypothetical protein